MTDTIQPGPPSLAGSNKATSSSNTTDADGLDNIKDDFPKKLDALVWFAHYLAGKPERLPKGMPVSDIVDEWQRDGRILLALVESIAKSGKALVGLLD